MTPLLAGTEAALLAQVAAAQASGRLPSVAAGVVRGGELVWSLGRGRTVLPGSTGDDPRPDADTQYKIGSVTKTLTATLVMLARERGELGLDDPVARFCPDGPFGTTPLHRLLSHGSGISAEPTGEWWERSTGGDLAALTAAHAGAEPVLEPGSRLHYSNLGYGVLGAVVEAVTGLTWWDAVQQQLLAPLGMGRTSYQGVAPYAGGYAVDALTGEVVAEPLPDTGAMAPAGQLWSTVADLGTWVTHLVDPERSLLRAETLVDMRTMRTADPDDRSGSGFGLGLSLGRSRGRLMVGHGGSMPGFSCGVLADVDRRVGAVVLTNGAYGLGGLTQQVLETVLDREPHVAPEWVPGTLPVPGVVREVVGTWHWGHAPAVLRWDRGLLRLAPPSGPGRVMAFAPTDDPDAFVGTAGYLTGETLRVVRRADGAVSHLECATFVYTRTPYDPQAPIPGGV